MLNLKIKKWLVRRKSLKDSRKLIIELTSKGRKIYKELEEASRQQIDELLLPLSPIATDTLISSMGLVHKILSGQNYDDYITIRTHAAGDIGYLSFMHGKFYSKEYGFDISFDSYVAGAMAKFIDEFNAQKDRLWIVEFDNRIMGSIAIVHTENNIAQLRWFILEPEVHGKGIGKKTNAKCCAVLQR